MNYSNAADVLLANDPVLNSTGLTIAGENVVDALTTAVSLLAQASKSLLTVCWTIIRKFVWHTAHFFLLRIPSWLVLSSSVNITLSVYTLITVLLAIMFATYFVLRDRFLHAYKRLQPDDNDEKLAFEGQKTSR